LHENNKKSKRNIVEVDGGDAITYTQTKQIVQIFLSKKKQKLQRISIFDIIFEKLVGWIFLRLHFGNLWG
jgi:hypothetical protein